MKKLMMAVAGAVLASGAFSAELPAGYTAVDHIVAQRGAYIDTGYQPNSNTRVVMDVTVQGAGEYWFGCWDEDYNKGAFALCNDGGGIYAGYGNQGGTFGSVVMNGRRKVELDKNVVKVDESPKYEFNAASFALANNLYLFAQNRKGTVGVHGSQTSVICHGCKIYDNGVEVRNFVPCTSPTGRAGLYDLVEQSFYALTVNLPSGYTAVEAIESTKGGGQFIDTGYTANGQTKVVFDARVPVRGEQEDQYGVLFGSRTMNDWAAKAFALQMCKGNSGVDTVRFTYNGEDRQDVRKPFSYGERVTVTCDGRHIEWTGSKAASVEFTAASLASSKSTLYIFADNTVENDGAKSKTGINPSVMRLYSFRISEGETLKRNFVPCVRTADAAAGLYDTVEGKFYGNAGTGAFTTPLPFGRELTSGTYEITESFVFVAPATESALKIADGATVTLKIAAGVEVMLRGGDAFEVWGAGAGLEVPANATLKVTGEGQLIAYGGKGANGCNGLNAGNGSANSSTGNFTSGAGGAGGWGGGGAGAGIGGKGGNGGGGGNGGKSVTGYNWSHTDISGNRGDDGGNGHNGGTCGTVSIEGMVKVVATGGAAGAANGAGGAKGDWAWNEGSTYYFGGWGGGGGGGGAKGEAAQDIGGGGTGGYGGGGGGSGAYLSRFKWNTFKDMPGWGAGGNGAANGAAGGASSRDGDDVHGGSGGAKGAAGAHGGSGTLTVADSASILSGEQGCYTVGRISETEHIRWERGHLYRVANGARSELPYSVVSAGTGTMETGWYVVNGAISRSKIDVNGTANLVLLHGASLTVSGWTHVAAISVPGGKELNIFGVESGMLTATGGDECAGIGGGDRSAVGKVTVNGGVVTATGGQNGAGIGGGWASAGGTVTINGGVVTATGGRWGAGIGGGDMGAGGNVTINGGTVTAFGREGGAGIGGGANYSGTGGSLTLGPRAIRIDGSHYQEGVSVSFKIPLGLKLLSFRASGGYVNMVGNDENRMACFLPGQRLILTFGTVNFKYRLSGDAEVSFGPFASDAVIDESQLPSAVEAEAMSVDYALPNGGTARAENVCPLCSTGQNMTMGESAWYVVTGEVSTAAIEVNGEANLILADGAKLTVNGGIGVNVGMTLNVYGQSAGTGKLIANGAKGCAGIGGRNPNNLSGYGNCGAVTINGGIVSATGGRWGAGIGGGARGASGTVTINGGTVTVQGGEGGAGIGCGFSGSGGKVTINGGTVTAWGGGGGGFGGISVTIDGGSIKASSIQRQPHNGEGKDVYRVTVEVEKLKVERLKVEGLQNYGTKDIVPLDGKVYLYLPNGTHSFSISDGSKVLNFYAVVNGRDTTVEPQGLGFTVNGTDIGSSTGTGWYYDLNGCLHLTGGGTYVLSGLATNDEVQVSVEASDARIVFSNAVVYARGRPALTVGKSLNGISLGMAGNVSYLVATNDATTGASVPAVRAGSGSEIFLASGGERLESMICVFNFGDSPAVDGQAPYVRSGSLCVWADVAAAQGAIGYNSATEIMAVGDDPESTRYAAESTGAKCVLVAPFCRVLVPQMPGIASCVVSNQDERISASETVGETNVFKVMEHDSVTVDFVAAEGYEILSGGSIVIPAVTNDVVIGSEAYPAPDVRRQLTVTLPETVEGETYVVTENGEEVGPSFAEATEVGPSSAEATEGRRVKVYPVRSGMDVEIVCTAHEGWRIVSETNVVTFANIQENQVLTAAELPEARRVFTVTVAGVENAYYDLSSTDDRMEKAGADAALILSNAEVTVTFVACDGYRITANGGKKTWTLTGDVTFGETEGFPLPTVEGIPGTVAAPWPVGENVVAYTNETGVLTIEGSGVMSNFTNAADVPWDPKAVTAVVFGGGVTKVGANAFGGFAENVPVLRLMATVLNNSIPVPAEPAGAITPAEFERIEIIDGKAYLDVSVYTSDTVTNSNWSVATNSVIEVPAPGKQGFFYLMSK